MELLTEQEKTACRQFLHIMQGCMDRCGNNRFDELLDELKESFNAIRSDVRQFDSGIMIIVAVGMLKAGKSTLINLMARDENASPTGFGTDTTLRPALITMGQPGECRGSILIYRNRSENLEEQKAGMQAVLDSLRGLPPEKEIERPLEVDLTPDKLKQALCKLCGSGNELLEREPLLVVIKLPYHEDGRMLQNGRMLLDMPGLDSANAEISLRPEKVFSDEQIAVMEGYVSERVDEVDKAKARLMVDWMKGTEKAVTYESLIRRCDLVLCLQSSVSPLNEKACDCLNSVLDMRSEATAWVVMNRMRNQAWLTPECMNAKWEEQEARAMKVFSKIKKGTTLNQSSCNLGEAYAGILEDERNIDVPDGSSPQEERRRLLERSRFLDLEEHLLNHLEQNGQATRKKYCVENLVKDIRSAIARHEQLRCAAVARYRSLTQRLQAWENAYNNLDVPAQLYSVQGKAVCMFKELEAAMRKACADKIPLILGTTGKIDGGKLDQYLETCFEKCKKLADDALLSVRSSHVQLARGGTVCGLGFELGTAVAEKCKALVETARQCVLECEGGDVPIIDDFLKVLSPVPNEDCLVTNGAAVKLHALQESYKDRENGDKDRLVSFIKFTEYGNDRYERAAAIWEPEIDDMVKDYLSQVEAAVKAVVEDPDGDTRCAQIVRDGAKKRLEPLKKDIWRKHGEVMRAKAFAKDEATMYGRIVSAMDDFAKCVERW